MTDEIMEKAFSDYLDSEECEKLEAAFFAAVRSAFLAGYEEGKAAVRPYGEAVTG